MAMSDKLCRISWVYLLDEAELLRDGLNIVRQSTWRLGMVCWFRDVSWSDGDHVRMPGCKYTLSWKFPRILLRRESV